MNESDPGVSRRTVRDASGSAPGAAHPPVNVQVSIDDFAAHIEPAIAADPRDPDTLMAVCRVFVDGEIGLAGYSSTDGGAHWSAVGLLPGLTPGFAGNPAVVFDHAGTGYICGIAATSARPRRGDALLWRTSDGGRTLTPPVMVIGGEGGLADHCSLAAEPRAPGPAPLVYATAIHVGAERAGLVFTRSVDGGRSFAPPVFPDPLSSPRVTAPVIAAAGNGTVCLLYLVPAGRARDLIATTSTDHGESFAPPVKLAAIRSQTPGFGEAFSAKSGPTLAADCVTGWLYAAVTSYGSVRGSSKILLCTSTDQGRTWSEPTAIASSRKEIYLQPQLAAHDGRAAVSCYVVDPATRRIDVRLYLPRPERRTFADMWRVTSQSFDPTLAPGTPPWLGNYQGLTATATGLHPVWTDTRTGSAHIFTTTLNP